MARHDPPGRQTAMPAHPGAGSEPDMEAVAGAAGQPARASRGLPVLVAIPAHPDPGGRGLVFEVRQQPDGRRALPVFSSVGRLADALGPAQPWAVLPLARARELMGAAGVGEVVLDPAAEPGTWRWQPEHLQALRRSLR